MSERRKFLLECGKSAALFTLMACNGEQLLAPCAALESDPAPDPAPDLRDVYIVDGFTGLQLGTKENPYSVRTAGEFDALLQFLAPEDFLAVHKAGRFKTKGAYRWGQYASRNLGKGWTVDGDAEISLDPDSITDVDSQPLFCLAGPARSVTGITTIGNHSILADRWRGSLRTGSVLLYGVGQIDRVTLKDFGSLGAESFVAEIVGSGSITNTVFQAFDPSASDTQVTARRILGSENGESITDKPCLMEGNETYASGDNWVQAHCIYWATNGRISNNKSRGARVPIYGDWGVTKGLEFDGNDFEDCEHGFQFKLSPDQDFSHENYRIGRNRIVSRGANVSLDTCGAPTSTRFIRGFEIDPSLTVENVDNHAEYTRGACRLAA